MTGITGSPYFPGGLFEETFAPGALKLEPGPSAPVKLQAATYYDAADQAGISRIYGGIHITADDFARPPGRLDRRQARRGRSPSATSTARRAPLGLRLTERGRRGLVWLRAVQAATCRPFV